MHHFGRFDERALRRHPTYDTHSTGYTVAELVNRATGSFHTGLSMNELTPAGTIDRHLHSFEESFYILSGEAIVSIGHDAQSYRLGPGDYGALKVGTPHAWKAVGTAPVRWLQMGAPQPKPPGAERDTFFPARHRALPADAPRLDPTNLKGSILGHFGVDEIPPPGQRQVAAAGLETVFLKWLIDENAGASHHRLLFIEYLPGASIALHDHTFEESYFILSGEVEGTMDGTTYTAKAGDVLWTSVGCVHTFRNVSSGPVRWLETFAPQPPKENVFRFMAEWNTRAKELEGGTS